MSVAAQIKMPQTAYIGVDGKHYRVLIPVQSIWLSRAEGPTKDLRDWTFASYIQASDQLRLNARTVSKDGTYDKHDFRIVFADGFAYSGRYDLTHEDEAPCLGRQTAEFLKWMRDELSETGLGRSNAPKEAGEFLLTYDLNQGPVPAPDDWQVVADYRSDETRPQESFPKIQARIFDLFPA